MSETREFDIALIGAGPTAVAALQALSGNESIVIISGESPEIVSREILHPKVQAVSVSNDELPGVVTAFQREHDLKRPLFAAALAGGLANYWGQQFIRYGSGDPWPRDIFEDFSSYQRHCTAVEKPFELTGGADVRAAANMPIGYTARIPRLLTGSAEHPSSDLMAMRRELKSQGDRSKAQILKTRAQSVIRANRAWNITLQNGDSINAKRILLAAGVVGTSQLLINSFDEIQKIRFSDHAPWMLYSIGLRAFFALRPPPARHHFNAMTLEKMDGDTCKVFASLYDMGQADLNLLLTSTIGRTFKTVRKWRAPIGASFLKPVQIWTSRSFDVIEIERSTGVAKAVDIANKSAVEDFELQTTLAVLRNLGARCLKVTRTAPGYGFHYHNLRIKLAGPEYLSVADFLRERCLGEVTCLDASILPEIGLRPHTLTAMAASHRIAATII